MPTVTLNKKVLEELMGKTLPLDELKDRISMIGTDLESIEGDNIHVEIFPNRPDMLSEQGFGRAFSSFLGIKTGLQQYEVKPSGHKVTIDPSVTMRPYTVCAIVKNLQFNDERIREIMQMQEKLATTHGRNRKKSAYGIYPLTNIKFPITYIAKDPKNVMFHPLGMQKKIPAHQVEELHPKGKEYKHVAEGWKEYPFFIDNEENVLCMLPYTNSHDTGKVDESTTEIFIECTGNDLKNITAALNMFVTMFADMGGEIYSLEMEYPDKTFPTPNLTPKEMGFDLEYINKRLGLNLKETEAVSLLGKMGYGFNKGTVLIPAYRADILHQADLVEDIAIAYGYENFEEIIPNVATIGKESVSEKFAAKLQEILIGLKLTEVKNYHLLTNEDANEKMNLENPIIPLKNAMGEHNHLRNSIIPSLLKNLTDNQHNEYPQNIFELGRVFTPGESETGVIEHEHLAILTCHEKTDFTEMRQILDSIFQSVGIEFSIIETTHPSYISGRVGEIKVNDKSIGIIGELHPEVLEKWQIIVPVVALELNREKIRK